MEKSISASVSLSVKELVKEEGTGLFLLRQLLSKYCQNAAQNEIIGAVEEIIRPHAAFAPRFNFTFHEEPTLDGKGWDYWIVMYIYGNTVTNPSDKCTFHPRIGTVHLAFDDWCGYGGELRLRKSLMEFYAPNIAVATAKLLEKARRSFINTFPVEEVQKFKTAMSMFDVNFKDSDPKYHFKGYFEPDSFVVAVYNGMEATATFTIRK